VARLQNCPGDSMAAAPGRPGCRSAALRLARQACSSYSPALSIWLAAPGLSLHTQTQAWCWCLYASLSRWQHSETGSYTLERRRHTPGWRELGMAWPLFGPWAAGPPSDALKALGVPVVCIVSMRQLESACPSATREAGGVLRSSGALRSWRSSSPRRTPNNWCFSRFSGR
jgi:hypothetical protein